MLVLGILVNVASIYDYTFSCIYLNLFFYLKLQFQLFVEFVFIFSFLN